MVLHAGLMQIDQNPHVFCIKYRISLKKTEILPKKCYNSSN